jgi:hypothetical protein
MLEIELPFEVYCTGTITVLLGLAGIPMGMDKVGPTFAAARAPLLARTKTIITARIEILSVITRKILSVFTNQPPEVYSAAHMKAQSAD